MTACHYVLQICDCVLFGYNVNTYLQNAVQNTVRVTESFAQLSIMCISGGVMLQ
jgi:hypothetical protein